MNRVVLVFMLLFCSYSFAVDRILNVWPPLADRQTATSEEIAKYQDEWKEAKSSGLWKDRLEIIKSFSMDVPRSDGGTVACFKYSNAELIDIYVDIFEIEYECKKNNVRGLKNINDAYCIHEVADYQNSEQIQGYWENMSWRVLSTFSPRIIGFALSYDTTNMAAVFEYFLNLDLKYKDKVLKGLVDKDLKVIRYLNGVSFEFEYESSNRKLLASYLMEIVNIIISSSPELIEDNYASLSAFISKYEGIIEPGDPVVAKSIKSLFNKAVRSIKANLEMAKKNTHK